MNGLGKDRCRARIFVVLLLPLLASCDSAPGVGHVEGTVRVRDQVLKSTDQLTWEVIYTSGDGKAHPAVVSREGKFSKRNVPPGLAKISVVAQPHVPPGLSPPGKPPPPVDKESKSLQELLARFRYPDKSGLTCTVVKGQQTHNIVLEP